MSKVDWSLAPEDATHYGQGEDCGYWAKSIGNQQYFINIASWDNGKWKEVSERYEEEFLAARPKQAWSGPEDGLPPVGIEIEIKIDFKKAPPYAIITLTELGVDVQNHTPRFQKVKVLYASSKYLVAESCGAECLTPMSCVEIRAIKTPEQLAASVRETAIRDVMDIAQVDCRVTAARLVDAGFKREVV